MVELLLVGEVLHVRDLLGAIDEQFEFLNHVGHFVDVAVILGLLNQIVDAEAAGYYQHQAFVELGSNVEETLIVVRQAELVGSGVPDHLLLLIVEELPD